MFWGLVGAFAAAVAYGTATILQAIGVRRLADAPAGTTVVRRLRLGWLYGMGLALDGIGFLASIAALRSLPLFLVESAVASSVAVTAILAVVVLGVRLAGREVAALSAVGLGLVLLAISALEGPPRHVHHHAGGWTLAAVIPVAAIGAAGLLTKNKAASSALLAVTSGLGYGVVGIAARILVVPAHWLDVIRVPAFWAIVAHGVIGLVAYGFALDRGRTTSVAAITFAVETIVPALIGLRFLGDGVRHHHGPVATIGFVITLAACILLASRSEPDVPADSVADPGR